MSWTKDAHEYAISYPPEKNATIEHYASQLYTMYQESLRTLHGAPYSVYGELSKKTQQGWIELAKKTAKRHKRVLL